MALIGIDGIFINGDNGQKIALSIVQGKVLQILRSNTLGIYASAVIENPGQVRAGTVTYRTTDILKTGNYATRLDGENGLPTQIPTVNTIMVNLDQVKSAKYKLEEFDLRGIQDAAAITAQIADGLALSVIARLDAELLDFITNYLAANPSQTITLADFSTATDIETIRLNRLKWQRLITTIVRQINSQMVGTEKNQTITITSTDGYANLIENVANQGGSRGTELRIQGTNAAIKIGGNTIVEHVYIKQNLDGSIITLDKTAATDFDFSKIEAILLNKDAIAFPIDLLPATVLADPGDGNPIFIQKIRYGLKVLRPQLIRGIINATLPTKAAANKTATK